MQLPFAVPSSAEMLVNFNVRDNFGPFSTPSPVPPHPHPNGADTPRSLAGTPSSPSNSVLDSVSDRLRRDSVVSSAASQTSSQDNRSLPTPVLPDEFFAVLDAAKAEALDKVPVQRHGTGLGLDAEPGDGDTGPGKIGRAHV